MSKQIVYIPIKVEDELPELEKSVFTFNTMIPGKVRYPPIDDGENISINCRTLEIPDKCEKWYDEHGCGYMYSKVNTWLKPQEGYFFTEEQLKQLLSDYTDKIVKKAEAYEKCESFGNMDTYPAIKEESIRNQLPKFLKTIGL